MDNYSFLAHINQRLGNILEREDLILDQVASKLSDGYQGNLTVWKSRSYKIRIFLEHYRVYVEIAPLASKDPNHWFEVDLVVAYTLNEDAKKWQYKLPRGIPLYQVVDKQLQRWEEILGKYIKKITPLFSDGEFQNIVDEMRKFRVRYYKDAPPLG